MMVLMTNIETVPSALPLKSGAWTLDQYHSAVGFTVRHLGVSKVRGRFGRFTADLVVGETVADIVITADIEIASIDTGNSTRDGHVVSSDMLDVASRPTMTFRSTRIQAAGDDWTLTGDLTIGEVTKPVTLDVEFGGAEKFPNDGRTHAGFEANGEIRRSDFGLGFGAGVLGDVVKITLDMQFLEPA
jgi:polyisoprenoid-binding protein YceI